MGPGFLLCAILGGPWPLAKGDPSPLLWILFMRLLLGFFQGSGLFAAVGFQPRWALLPSAAAERFLCCWGV